MKKDKKSQYKSLVREISRILDKNDPLNLATPPNEYESEAEDIVGRLASCNNPDETLTMIYRIFLERFGEDSLAQIDQYRSLAEKIYALKLGKYAGFYNSLNTN